MLAGLVFCIGAVKHGSVKEEFKKLAQQSKDNKRFMRDISRSYFRSK